MALGVVLGLCAACDAAPVTWPDSGAPPGLDAGAPELDAGTTQDAAEACTRQVLPLWPLSYGDTERYYVPAQVGDTPIVLQLDTGSALTFVFLGSGQPDYVPAVAELHLGCATFEVPGRGYDAPGELIQGRQVITLLGMEFLLHQPSRLDVAGRELEILPEIPTTLTQDPDASLVPLDNVLNHALVPCTLDGDAVRLMFDTGAGHTLRVGVAGRPGDREEQVVDAQGTVFSVFVGTGVLRCGAYGPVEVPVARAPAFPYFEETVQSLGGNLHGLLGVTAFPGRQIVVDGAQDEMWAVPRP